MPGKSESDKVDTCFYGTATVGERGQVVIPAELRKELEVQPGDKMLIWKHPSGKGILLLPVNSMREFMNMMLATLESVEGNEPDHPDDQKPQ